MLDKFLKIERYNSHFSSTLFIISSLLLGIAIGLLLGEYAAKLQIIGDIYIGLLQMTVLPYIVFALIANIGRLNYIEAKLLTKYGLLVLLTLWLIGITCVWAMSIALPKLNHGAFFSSLLMESPPQIDFLKLFIPSNPFKSLTENSVPAVVIFSMLFGTASIGYKEHKSLLNHFDHVAKILLRVNSFVVMLAPIGIFSISASAAGTLTLEQFGQVQSYVLMLVATVILVTLVILPMLIVSCTPFSYRQIARESSNILLTVFVVGSVFVVIPLLTRSITRLFHSHIHTKSEHARLPDIVLPLAYPFPDIGKILSFVFIVFAGWFYDRPLDFLDYPGMLALGIFLSFGKLISALPFLLDLYHIPDDIFNLFIAVGVICGRFADLAGAMHLMTFTILTTAMMTGVFKIKWKMLIHSILISCLLLLGISLSIRTYLEHQIPVENQQKAQIMQMALLNNNVAYTVSNLSQPNPTSLKSGQHLLDRIRHTGVIRVGVHEDSLPFSFYNMDRQLVGFDIDLIMHLAEDLGVSVEFIPYESGYLHQQLEDDYFDIAISGISPSLGLLSSTRVLYSDSYLDVHLALVVPDHRRNDFSDFKSIGKLKNILAGIKEGSNFNSRINSLFPNFIVTELNSEDDIFNDPEYSNHILLTSAEGGSAWTLINPDYVVVNPFVDRHGAPLVIVISEQDLILEHFISSWIKLKQTDGTIDAIYAHWILGKTITENKPRWNLINHVLNQENTNIHENNKPYVSDDNL